MTQTLIPSTSVEVTPLAGNIGAEIGGMDTGGPLTDETVSGVRQALLRHKVVFLRDQHLDYARQVAFAQRLGPLTLGGRGLARVPASRWVRWAGCARILGTAVRRHRAGRTPVPRAGRTRWHPAGRTRWPG